MQKVLLYQSQIPHYRRPIFEELGKYVDLTIAYTSGECQSGAHYSVQKIKMHRIPKVGYWHGLDFIRLAKKSDILISMLAPGYLDINLIKCFAPKIKHIRWGIGVQAGYETRYDSPIGADVFLKIVRACDAALFYSEYPRNKYARIGIDPQKMFVANNTVAVKKINAVTERQNLIFIGTLYAQKRVDILLDAYAKAASHCSDIPNLVIVGDGDERGKLMAQAQELYIADRVSFKGKVEDERILLQLFSEAIACISPDQAGLSVLTSMGYGVPFVTMKNAITGGEIFNIVDKQNGVLFEKIEDLPGIIADIGRNKEKYIEYGRNAFEHYYHHRLPTMMVDGFMQAIDYVSK